MKLHTRNFTGYLPNGHRYKIVVTTKHGFVNAYLYEEKDGVFWVESVAQSLFKEGYRTYLEALKTVLTAMQNSYNLDLIKAP